MDWFNPTLREMTEKNPDITIWGLWWAMTWRTVLAFYGAVFLFLLVVELLS